MFVDDDSAKVFISLIKMLQLPCQEDKFLTLLPALEQEGDLRYQRETFFTLNGEEEVLCALYVPGLFFALCRSYQSLLKWPTGEM